MIGIVVDGFIASGEERGLQGIEPAIMKVRIADRRVDEVADLSSLRLGGRLAGLEFSLDPNDVPVLLRDTGTQEIYSLQKVFRK
jgi:hypothetical protein